MQFKGTKHKGNYKILEKDQEKINQAINLFSEAADLPSKTIAYYDQYGFDNLVAAVSKWVDFNGTIVREYDLDRLWIGEYIYFLEKATEYKAWSDSNNAQYRKMIKDSNKKASK